MDSSHWEASDWIFSEVLMWKTKGKIRTKLLCITIIPLVMTGIAILITTYFAFSDTVHKEVHRGLQDIAIITQRMMDRLYIGDYFLKEENGYYYIYKGNINLTGNDKILQEIRQDTDVDLTIFYQDTRVLTTLKGPDGESYVGTVAHPNVVSDVLKEKKEMFYKKVLVGDVVYFAYYAPLYNGDGTCVGMIFAGKPTEVVNREIMQSLIPILIVIACVVVVSCFICTSFTKDMVMIISRIKTFLRELSKGNLKADLDSRIMQRNDELGEMGRFTVRVQKFLREMVEKDMLTKLYSRRIGEVKLRQVQEQAVESGTTFCVAMGDIDFFKKFNDTYGHDCGDKVLKEIANLIANSMIGKGFAVRWGGEEFLIIYENDSLETAREHLEKVREAIMEYEVEYNEEILRVTMTFGIVEGFKEEDIAKSIKIADDFLYQGKMNGRNCIVGVSLEV